MKTYGGSKSDIGYSIVPTTDGGYVLTGETYSNNGEFNGMNKGYNDIFVLKLNSNGDTIWKKTYGGVGLDWSSSITTSNDGGYILTGITYSNDGDFSGMNKDSSDIFVMKLNSNGDIVWKRTYGGSSEDYGYSITTTTDGGHILTGFTSSNDSDFSGMKKGNTVIFVLKLNSSGEIEWKKTFGGSGGENGKSITNTYDGGYVLTGFTLSNDGDFSGMNKGGREIFVIKLNSSGEIVWKRTYGGSSDDYGWSITNTNDSGFVLTDILVQILVKLS